MQFCGIKQNDMEKTLIQLIKAVGIVSELS